MADKKPVSQRKRVLLFVLLSAAAMAVCMGIVMGIAVSLITDGIYEFPTQDKVYAVPDGKKQTADFVIKAVDGAKDTNTVYVDTSVGVEINDLEYSGSESEKKLLDHMKEKITQSIDGFYPENHNESFADGYTDYPVLDFTGVKIIDAVSEVDKDKIVSVIKTDGFITAFDTEDDALAEQKMLEAFSSVLTVTSSEIIPAGTEIKSEIYADDDTLANPSKIKSIEIKRFYSVKLTVVFKNDLSSLESRDFSLSYCVKEKYAYTWAGISCDKTLTLAPGKEHKLKISAVLNDYSEYKTTFISDNENVAVIDELGYIKGVSESTEPAVITVCLDYLGHKYYGKCSVFVGNPVEKIKISDRKLELNTGENAVLSATVLPENATDKSVIWITDDSSVAAVENGTVTAVGAGSTCIRAVTNDGSFQAVCTVTVL